MANLSEIMNANILDSILPKYGTPRQERLPIWDESQKMFICEEHTSPSGNRYYKGIRFCEDIVVVEQVGLFHNWTYIDSIELYRYNGTKLELVQKRTYEKQFHNATFIKSETKAMLTDFINGMLKLQRANLNNDQIESSVDRVVEGCYKSFLDTDYKAYLTGIIKQIEVQ